MAEANLLTWAGEWGIPSLDPTCLQVMAYSQFAVFPVKVTCCNNPYKSPTATLPVLQLTDDMFCGFDDIVDYLKENNFNTDEVLSDKQKMDTLGLCCYVEEMLRPALLYMTWLVDQNYTQFTRGFYAKQLKFPYNYIIPAKYFNHAKNFIAHKLNIDEGDVISEVTEIKLQKRAEACFEVVNSMLGDQEFLFGDSPTTLDSKVFSYLHIMLRIPLPTNKLKSSILEHPNLQQYCDKIIRLYFPKVAPELRAPNELKSEEENSRKNKINAVISVGFAVLSMVFYALSNGIVHVDEIGWGKRTGKTTQNRR
ncbi:metaxin-1-like [Dendronephthya gigantea]|uniref:metaxin-1-like n=1 Tax=Dendronephthya gigantea TaxID=151771 RepID=UPI00106B965F|nr:metaxin-1-like [Dendronephthya gigantea]